MNHIWIVAQADGTETPLQGISSTPVTGENSTTIVANDPNSNVETNRTKGNPMQFVFIGLMFVIMYFLLFRGPKKKQQQHKKMVQSLEKNDRVRTIGGIIGTVIDIKDEEVTLKIDESNNTKIKVVPSAIGSNMSKEKD